MLDEFYGTRYQSGSFYFIYVGSVFCCVVVFSKFSIGFLSKYLPIINAIINAITQEG